MKQKKKPTRKRLVTYVDDVLFRWIRRHMKESGATESSVIRLHLMQAMRDEE